MLYLLADLVWTLIILTSLCTKCSLLCNNAHASVSDLATTLYSLDLSKKGPKSIVLNDKLCSKFDPDSLIVFEPLDSQDKKNSEFKLESLESFLKHDDKSVGDTLNYDAIPFQNVITPLQNVNMYPAFDADKLVFTEDYSFNMTDYLIYSAGKHKNDLKSSLKRKNEFSLERQRLNGSGPKKTRINRQFKEKFYGMIKGLCSTEWKPRLYPKASPKSEEYRKELLFWVYQHLLKCNMVVNYCKPLEEFTLEELLDHLSLQISIRTGLPYHRRYKNKYHYIWEGLSLMFVDIDKIPDAITFNPFR